jgi:hypothetical protein
VTIVKRFRTENAAFKYEARLVRKIGLENLTNVAPGGVLNREWVKYKDPNTLEKGEVKKRINAIVKLVALLDKYGNLKLWNDAGMAEARAYGFKALWQGIEDLKTHIGGKAIERMLNQRNIYIDVEPKPDPFLETRQLSA